MILFELVIVESETYAEMDSSTLLVDLGYVYTGSDMFRSVWDRIHYGTDPLCLHGTGSKLERYSSIWDHLHKWIHLVPDSRSDPYRICHVPCKHKAHPYQFRTGSKRIRSSVNAALNYGGWGRSLFLVDF